MMQQQLHDSEESSMITGQTSLQEMGHQKWRKYLSPIALVIIGVLLVLLLREKYAQEQQSQLAKYKDMPNQNPKEAFEYIYKNKMWGQTGYHHFGLGSISVQNAQYIILLQHIIDFPQIKKIVEIGFGDWQITGQIIFDKSKKYIGYDVVENLLRPNQTNKQFRLMNDIEDFDESGDLLIIKDVLMHWPNAKIKYFMENVVPRFKYVLLTSDYTTQPRKDIPYGLWSQINLEDYGPKQLLLTIDTGFDVDKRVYIFPSMPTS